ncbi:MAG: sugar transferase [Chloroflexota bacterium]|nr:sugar transferase [Chloroflexota bacterium]
MTAHVLPVPRRYVIAKRAFDLSVCLILLPAIVLVLVASAIAIRIDSAGPIVFRQQRTGRHGRRFGMYKFRTMVRNAEELKAELQHLSIVPAPDFKVIDDPRITRIGHFLRKTSLDELPQLLNVIRGEMSLVGPRPTSFAPHTYDLWHTERLEVLPGVTGLWQVIGRNAATFDERLRLDIAYIDRMSFRLDLWILIRTALAVVRRSGA